jgi:hypothetical protein
MKAQGAFDLARKKRLNPFESVADKKKLHFHLPIVVGDLGDQQRVDLIHKNEGVSFLVTDTSPEFMWIYSFIEGVYEISKIYGEIVENTNRTIVLGISRILDSKTKDIERDRKSRLARHININLDTLLKAGVKFSISLEKLMIDFVRNVKAEIERSEK